jgi:hypothetical protein
LRVINICEQYNLLPTVMYYHVTYDVKFFILKLVYIIYSTD